MAAQGVGVAEDEVHQCPRASLTGMTDEEPEIVQGQHAVAQVLQPVTNWLPGNRCS